MKSAQPPAGERGALSSSFTCSQPSDSLDNPAATCDERTSQCNAAWNGLRGADKRELQSPGVRRVGVNLEQAAVEIADANPAMHEPPRLSGWAFGVKLISGKRL
jgi:hypothetical protein